MPTQSGEAAAGPQKDERLQEAPLITRLMRRPELGAVAGLILITLFFSFTASGTMFSLSGFMTFMSPAAQLGILAIGAAALMIGGEFDPTILKWYCISCAIHFKILKIRSAAKRRERGRLR